MSKGLNHYSVVFFIQCILEKTIYRMTVNSSQRFVPKPIQGERLSSLPSLDYNDVSHMSLHKLTRYFCI